MISKAVVALAATAILLATLSFSWGSSAGVTDEYELWKNEHQVVYSLEENSYRQMIFHQTLKRIAEHNSRANSSYQLGLNQFSAMSQDQFAKLHLSPVPSQPQPMARKVQIAAIPTADIDWQAKGVVSPVKNQGACSASYAFSTIGAIEGSYSIAFKNTVQYSVQQIVDCSYGFGNNGCYSGSIDMSLEYVLQRGINTANAYPYHGKEEACLIYLGKLKIKAHVSQTGCTALANSLSKTPVAAFVSATNWKDYRSGIYTDCDQNVNAAVLVTGMTDAYWRAKNSWGVSWGENGYIRISRSSDCGICKQTAYAEL